MIMTDATNLPRLMKCNASRLLQADPSYAERDNTIREEGNAAHWLASVVFKGEFTAIEMIDRKAPNGVYITADMAEHVTDYVNAVGLLSGAYVEWAYSISGQGWQVNGRADAIKWECHPNDQYETPYWLHIDDFKYGYSIVEPEDNWTLISHAIGYCVTNNIQPQFITFRIHQPRAAHRDGQVRAVTLTYEELTALYWQINATLGNPSDLLATGPHCYKCPSFTSCTARQDAELNAIEVSHVGYNAQIENDDLAFRLDQIHRAQELLKQSEKAYLELGAHRVKIGQVVNGHLLETELTNRMWKDGMTPDWLAAFTGRDISTKKLPSPRQAEQAGIPSEFVALWSERKPKGAKLVRIDANKKAKKMFGDKR